MEAGWATAATGITIADESSSVLQAGELVSVALRLNARRLHLLVSSVLGKHIPTHPEVVYGAGLHLGDLVGRALGTRTTSHGSPVVLGYAETATALGASVADVLEADYIHTTRRPVAGVHALAEFFEEHSHAARHLLLPEDPEILAGPGPLILADDELSTGQTALNTINVLHGLSARRRYLIACLVDVRSAADRARMAGFAAERGIELEIVALATASVHIPPDATPRARKLIEAREAERSSARYLARDAGMRRCPVRWPSGVPDGGRHGVVHAQRLAAGRAAQECARDLANLGLGERVLVLATEELMYFPLLLARRLAEISKSDAGGRTVLFSSTTRSPVLDIDEAGYPVRTRLAFVAHDRPADGEGRRFAYNVAPGLNGAAFSDAVVVVDDTGDTAELVGAGGLVDALSEIGVRVVLVCVPSYRPAAATVPEAGAADR
ncbi:MAG: phosphoribosyltransferase family protein [Actinomycetota bacterium]|nr:phosphoribosyltransferase family protein [Actinomycetota bacterium]